MYRNCYKCNCKQNWNNNNNNDVASDFEDCIQEKCSDVENTLGLSDDCECGYDEYNSLPENPVLAQSYVPIQTMDQTFKPCVGLKMGTIFPELVSPYMPGQSMAEIQYLKARNEIKEGCNKC